MRRAFFLARLCAHRPLVGTVGTVERCWTVRMYSLLACSFALLHANSAAFLWRFRFNFQYYAAITITIHHLGHTTLGESRANGWGGVDPRGLIIQSSRVQRFHLFSTGLQVNCYISSYLSGFLCCADFENPCRACTHGSMMK